VVKGIYEGEGVWKRDVRGLKETSIHLRALKSFGLECKRDGIEFSLCFGLGLLNPCLNLCTCLGKGLGLS